MRAGFGSALPDAILELVIDSIGNEKLGIFGIHIFLYEFDLCFTQRLAVRFVGILFVRRTVPDVAVHNDERWPVLRLRELS